VTGGIAAYKAAGLLRLFKKAGASVQVVGTENSLNFIGASTWRALSGKEPLFETFQSFDTSRISHITLAQDIDAIVIAPATANIVAKCANGICDDLLSTILNARKVPVIFAPGMNTAMYENPSTQRNIDFLKGIDDVFFVDPEEGELACNTNGKGRMAEPDEIFRVAERLLEPKKSSGLRWLVSGGATREYIDPIRFITNGSSGKTGHYIACEAARSGGNVTFVGANVDIPEDRYTKVNVTTAQDMYDVVMNRINDCDVLIMSAAVADFSPVKEDQKIKKGEGSLEIRLDRTKDILKSTIDVSNPKMVRIGFAAETRDLEDNAVRKMNEKKLDMIVANLVSKNNDPFGSDTNSVKLITPEKIEMFDNLDKKALSRLIVERAVNIHKVKNEGL
jgi:phosphopantothenoylcysteine decarboxylase/phosphopantothenate--cysteine ligase